jgi:ADP-ribose pyrophosphatase YjhB (NUDIX family)
VRSQRELDVPFKKIVSRSLQRYWRISRGLTLDTRIAVIDEAGKFLLVRRDTSGDWEFPGGEVANCMSVAEMLRHHLRTQAGISTKTPPELFAVYATGEADSNAHIALFVARAWQQTAETPNGPAVANSNDETNEKAFFAADAMPAETSGPTRQRIAEIIGSLSRTLHW